MAPPFATSSALHGILAVAGVLAMVLPLGAGADAATAAPSAAAVGARADAPMPDPSSDRSVDLHDDTAVPHDHVRSRGDISTWSGRSIRYRETIPARWQWSLDRAIRHWNGSGGNIKFVKVSSPRRAQLTIRYGDTGDSDGVATVGQTDSAYVHLSPRYRGADARDPTTRVWVGRLFAHELGHVLGFEHTSGACSLMVPIFVIGGKCGPLSSNREGWYQCRWVNASLLRRFIATYGGTAKRPPAQCLIGPLRQRSAS